MDDLPAVCQATNDVLRKAGRPAMSLDEFRSEFCLPYRGFFAKHTPEVPIDELEVWFHAAFRSCEDTVTPLPHARGFLEFCRESNLRTALLSTIGREHYFNQSAKCGFGEFLQATYLGIRDKREVIGKLLTENDFKPVETMFVGDMAHDIETAKVGGVHSCAVLTGFTKAEALKESHPDLIVANLGELQKLLEENEMELAR